MFRSRKFYISLVGAVAWSSTTADTILSILEAASFSATHVSLVHIAAAAGALDAVSLCCIGFYTYQELRRDGFLERSARSKKILNGVVIFLSTTALITSIALIGLIKSRWHQVTAASSASLISNWTGLISGQIAMWVVSCICQIILYSSPFWNRKAPQVQTVAVSGPRDSVMSEVRTSQATRPLYLAEPTKPSSVLLAALPSPTFSSRSSNSLQSFRDSLRQVVRPVTSRTTLISRPSLSRDGRSIYSESNSVDNVSHSDGFDTWDTRDALVPTAPSKGTALEPIPGSRPNSPARALDGPFTLSELPEEDDEELARPPRMMPDTSRPPSPVVSEAHIHPLFRTESPLPPPATPGTSIIASPLSNQAIACPARPFSRMRSNSRTASPSPLVQTQRITRDRSTSAPSLSRSPSPPGRALTPPIPDFILNSSPRSSLSGSRRVNLQYSPDR